MKVKYILFAFQLLLLFSCDYGTNLTITNNSDNPIDSIIVATDFNSLALKELKSMETKTVFLDFKNNHHQGDGIIRLVVYKNRKIKSSQFGYYSNGVPPDDDFVIKILNDTILIDFE